MASITKTHETTWSSVWTAGACGPAVPLACPSVPAMAAGAVPTAPPRSARTLPKDASPGDVGKAGRLPAGLVARKERKGEEEPAGGRASEGDEPERERVGLGEDLTPRWALPAPPGPRRDPGRAMPSTRPAVGLELMHVGQGASGCLWGIRMRCGCGLAGV